MQSTLLLVSIVQQIINFISQHFFNPSPPKTDAYLDIPPYTPL
nr:MAG TPA: hypothetical protein [Caudoviricetes sp.]